MRLIHLAAWLGAVSRPQAAAFVSLFMCFALMRASLVTVLPLAVHGLLDDAQLVSMAYFGVGVFGLAGGLGTPFLVQRYRRRTVLTAAAAAAIVAPALMAQGSLAAVIAGMALHVLALGAIEITLNLFLMDHIPRRDFNNFEPTRVFFTAGIWTVGPWLGVWLGANAGAAAPFALAAFAAAALLGYFWYLRMTESAAVAPRRKPSPNPLVYLPRFYAQPRLVLAWGLAIGRTAWWALFFIYAPIYLVTAGLSEVQAGAIVSLSTATYFLVPLWGRFARRRGIRVLLVAGYGATGALTVLAGLLMGSATAGTIALLAAATAAAMIDAAGNVPYLRAVHAHERPEMTTVYNTYRGVAQLLPPGVFAILLKLFELPAVFVAGGLAMLALTRLCRYLPRRL